MNHVRALLVTLTVAYGFAPTLATAQEIPGVGAVPGDSTVSPDSARVYQLDAVTVTATRFEVDRSRIPQKVDVVTQAELSLFADRTAAEALRSTTPLDVIEYPGLLTAVSIRGFRPQLSGISPRTLILVDGRPAGTSNLALLHAGALDRIEVLRGPASALYGSSAMGGVVNLITRRTAGTINGTGSLGYGSFGAYQAQARAGGQLTSRVDFDVSLAGTGQREGYRVGSNRTFAEDSLLKSHPDGSNSMVPWVTTDSTLSYSEFGSRGGSGRLGYALTEGWRLDLAGEGFRAEGVQNPGDLNVTDYDSRSLKDIARGSIDLAVTGGTATGRHSPSGRLFAAHEIVDYYSAPVSPNFVNFRTPVRTAGAQIQDAVRFGEHDLVLGADYTSVEARSEAYSAGGVRDAPFSPDVRIRSAALFGQARLTLLDGGLAATASARLDGVVFDVLETPELVDHPANSERHLVLTPSAGLRYTLLPGVQLYGNVGRGFITPDAFHVAGYSERSAGPERDAVFVTRGDPDLRPETSSGFDAGIVLARPAAGLDLELTYFRNDVRDRITTRVVPGTADQLTADGDTILSLTTYVNADRARSAGIEGRLGWEVASMFDLDGSLRLFANGTRMVTANERLTAQETTMRTRNVADLTLIAGIDFADLGPVSGRLSGRYVGERFDSDYVAYWAPGEILYPAYLVLDLATSFRLDERFRVGINVRNLADEDYFEVRGYNLPGRSVGLSVQAAF